MRFQLSIRTKQAEEVRRTPIQDEDLEQLVGEMVRRELARLAAQAPQLPRPPDQAEILSAVQWLAPFLQQTVLEAVRLGLGARGQVSPGVAVLLPELPSGQSVTVSAADAATPRQAGLSSDEQEEKPGSISVPPPLMAAREPDEAGGTPALQAQIANPTAPPTTAVETLEPLGVSTLGGATGPVRVRVTLVATPLVGFAPVRQFLQDLGRVPGIRDAQTLRFTGGRLYVALTTHCPDAESLAAALQAELAAYRPVVESAEGDLIEVRLTGAG